MRYNSERLDIKVVISGNGLLFKDIKISLGLLIIVRKMHALFRENHYLEVSTTANNRIRVCCRTQNSKQILLLSILSNKKLNIISSPSKSSGCKWGFISFFSSKSLSSNKHTVRLLHETSQFLSDSTIFEFSYGYSNWYNLTAWLRTIIQFVIVPAKQILKPEDAHSAESCPR